MVHKIIDKLTRDIVIISPNIIDTPKIELTYISLYILNSHIFSISLFMFSDNNHNNS